MTSLGGAPGPFVAPHPANSGVPTLSLRCPRCRQRGTFEGVLGNDIQSNQLPPHHNVAVSFGLRRCPNPSCHLMVFVTYSTSNPGEFACLPPETIDFDTAHLPPKVVETVREAITCHGNGCYRAAAVMVRRALEEVCDDQDATGANLQKRIEALSTKITLPPAFLAGLHDLRYLGNDAVHLELKDFDDVGSDEAEAGIEVLRVLLMSLYQYVGVMQKLAALKKPAP